MFLSIFDWVQTWYSSSIGQIKNTTTFKTFDVLSLNTIQDDSFGPNPKCGKINFGLHNGLTVEP